MELIEKVISECPPELIAILGTALVVSLLPFLVIFVLGFLMSLFS